MCSQQDVHRDVTERVAAFLTLRQRACARRASKALWEAVRAALMEDMLRVAVLEYQDASALDAQLVVVAMSRVVVPRLMDALVEWCGGLALLYDELQLRFPHAAAMGISAHLAAIRPFPFASGSTVMTVCVLTAVARSALVLESVELGVPNAANVLVHTLSHNGSPCPILCLAGARAYHTLDVFLPSLTSICRVETCAFKHAPLRSVCLANLPLLESIGNESFAKCGDLSSVDISSLPSLRRVGVEAFKKCESLQSISLANLPLLESLDAGAFINCVSLSIVHLSSLPSLQRIGESAFGNCRSLQSISFTDLPLLECIDDGAFAGCVHLSHLDLSASSSLRCIGRSAFFRCTSLCSIRFADLPQLESIGDNAFDECALLSTADLSGLRSLCKPSAAA